MQSIHKIFQSAEQMNGCSLLAAAYPVGLSSTPHPKGF